MCARVTSLFVHPETSKPSGDLLGGLDMKTVGDETEQRSRRPLRVLIRQGWGHPAQGTGCAGRAPPGRGVQPAAGLLRPQSQVAWRPEPAPLPARPLEVGEAGPSGEFTLQPGSAPLLAHKCRSSLRLHRPVSLSGGEEEGGSGRARSSQPGEAGRRSQELLGSALQERRVQEAVGGGIPRRRNSTCKALSV